MKWKMGVSILSCCGRAGERVYHLHLLRFLNEDWGELQKMACSWKVEESIDEPIFTQNLHREITVRMQRERHGA